MCVIAAVSVVFPWSTCPIVPTFTCGFVRSNLPFAIFSLLDNESELQTWCPWRGSNARPLPYQGSALPLSHMGRSTIHHRHRLGDVRAAKPLATGAGDGNRTRVISLEGWGSTIELLPLGRQN